jgi:MFS family permease
LELQPHPQLSPLVRGIAFMQRQQRDWRVTVARTSLDKFLYQMIFPYISIYIVALGASASQLGMVISTGMIIAGFVSPFIGWFIDRSGPRRLYLFGIGTLAVSYLFYGLAQDWTLTVVAMVAFWLGNSMSTQSCATVCGNCLANRDRATGMMICESVAAGLMGMAGPIAGAWLVRSFGGMNAAGIRPIFFICLIGTVGTFSIVWTQLSNRRWGMANRGTPNLIKDLHEVLKEGRYLKRWLLIASLNQLPVGMVFPFATVFAHEFKGADELVLGAMVTGAALTSVLFGIPLGRLADRVGRKRVLFLTAPLFWASILVLVWAPHPLLVVAAGVLQGFYYIGMPIGGAMERELVPPEHMGRWLGIARFFKMIALAALTFASGLIWDRFGPAYVFFAFVGLDLLVRMPLLAGMPETLRLRPGGPAPAEG